MRRSIPVLGAAFPGSAFRDWKGKPMCLQQLSINDERLHMAMKVAQIGTVDWNIPTGRVYWSANRQSLIRPSLLTRTKR